MSLAANKAIARQFCESLNARDIARTLDLMSDDVNYWILGRPDIIPSAGPHTKEQMARIFRIMMERIPGEFRFTAKSIIGEEDEIALEAESYGTLTNGRVYNNLYHIRMRLRDSKIVEAREYLDTQHVHAVWFAA